MLYSVGASWNPKMSVPNTSLARRVAGLYGIKGLGFAYRLNQWGPKIGPPMMVANTFSKAASPSGLSGALTWLESLVGMESAPDILTDATNTANAAVSQLSGAQTAISDLSSQAVSYQSSTDTTVQSKANACVAEAAGLLANLSTLQTALQNLQTQITGVQGTTDTTVAQPLKDQASALSSQVSTFGSGVTQLQKDVQSLTGQAQSTPGVTAYIENLISSSTSKLVWLGGGAVALYLLWPRLVTGAVSGARKAL